MSKAESIKRVSAVVAKFVPWYDVPASLTTKIVQWDGKMVIRLPNGRWSAYRETREPWIDLYLGALSVLGLVCKGDIDPYREWLVAERQRKREREERAKLAELIDRYGVPERKRAKERP